MGLKSFFKSLGKAFAKVGLFILSRVTDDQLAQAMSFVRIAADKALDNAGKREWVVAKIMTELHLPESLARWLVETAVQQLKSEAHDVLDKVEEKAKTVND